MDKLDKCYIWHVVTLAKLRLKRKEVTVGKTITSKNTHKNILLEIISQIIEIIKRRREKIWRRI